MTPSMTQHTALYLDIDGVLLRRTGTLGLGGTTIFELAVGASQFLSWAARRFEVFWLSARTASGESGHAMRAFRHAAPSSMRSPAFVNLIGNIRAAPWQDAKIDGIDIKRDFLWIDDDPDPVSVRRLAASGLSHRLLRASSDDKPDILTTLPEQIAMRLGKPHADQGQDIHRSGWGS